MLCFPGFGSLQPYETRKFRSCSESVSVFSYLFRAFSMKKNLKHRFRSGAQHSVLRRVWEGIWGRVLRRGPTMGLIVKGVLRRVLRRGSEKGVSRRCPERPIGDCDPLGVRPIRNYQRSSSDHSTYDGLTPSNDVRDGNLGLSLGLLVNILMSDSS